MVPEIFIKKSDASSIGPNQTMFTQSLINTFGSIQIENLPRLLL